MNLNPVGYLLTYRNRRRGTSDVFLSYYVTRDVASNVIEHSKDETYICHLINSFPIYDEDEYVKLDEAVG